LYFTAVLDLCLKLAQQYNLNDVDDDDDDDDDVFEGKQ